MSELCIAYVKGIYIDVRRNQEVASKTQDQQVIIARRNTRTGHGKIFTYLFFPKANLTWSSWGLTSRELIHANSLKPPSLIPISDFVFFSETPGLPLLTTFSI